MTNELKKRPSSLFDMTPIQFFGNRGQDWLKMFEENQVRTDIHENEHEYLVEVELPGIPKENIQVTYDNQVLMIEGHFETDSQEEDYKGKLVYSERSYKNIRRQYLLKDVQEDRIKASYVDGVLTVTLPKEASKQEMKKAIPIE